MSKARLIRRNRYKMHEHIIQLRETNHWWISPYDPNADGCLTSPNRVVFDAKSLQEAESWLSNRYESASC